MATSSKVTPQPRQLRAEQTIEAVINAASSAITSGGESSVRIQDISKSTGVSIGSIYHHFGDRDGVVRAAYVHKFASTAREDIERAKRWIAGINSANDLRDHTDEIRNFLTELLERKSAVERAAVIGQMAGRPLLQRALGEVQQELTNSLTEAMQLLHDRKMLKPEIAPRAAAVVMQGLLFGRVIAELEIEPVSNQDWNAAAMAALSGMLSFE